MAQISLNKAYGRFSVLLCGCLLAMVSNAATQLRVGLMLFNGAQRAAYNQLGQEFENSHPGIKLQYLVLGEDYKQQFPQLLRQSPGMDVLYWQAGERLFDPVREGLVATLDDVWQQQGFPGTYNLGIQQTVQLNGHYYAVPYSYYQWGFYYRQSLFDKLHLQPPQTWEELLKLCQTLRAAGIVPFAIGLQDQWPAAAWFDYLDLRLNGIQFHQQLLQGQIAYTDPRVLEVLRRWQQLIMAGYFLQLDKADSWDLRDALPPLYHNQAAMVLIGNFVTTSIPKDLVADFRYFRFPQIDAVPVAEEAPTDVFLMPRNAPHPEAAKEFLSFIGSAAAQSQLNRSLGMIPTHPQASLSEDYFIHAGFDTLQQAAGITQFFDRDTPPAMAKAALKIFADFFSHPDPVATAAELESERQHSIAGAAP